MEGVSICVPVCVRRADELAGAVARAAAAGDAVELRFDCLEASELERALALLGPLLDAHPRPFVFTFRTHAQGGARAFGSDERARFWSGVRTLLVGGRATHHFVDVEFDGAESDAIAAGFDGLCRVIRSHHDFAGVPDDLEGLYARMCAARADLLKLAVTARDAADCVPVFNLMERARGEGRALVALAMGEAGVATRVLGPARGAPLAYASLDAGRRTAPGQLDARELREVYRVGAHNCNTAVYGLVGSPVSHTLSPHMHNAALAARGLDAVYVPFDVTDLAAFFRRVVRPATREVAWEVRGLSVTAPHKSSVVGLLDAVEPRAAEIGAVNTVLLGAGGELRGDNTDADGALAPLEELTDVRGARVAVLGAGGAARALLWALRGRGADTVVFARDPARARATAERFGADASALEEARLGGFDVVVNTTPLGTRGARERETPATAAQLEGASLAYDLVYNPSDTAFLREARAAGCRTLGGLPMLAAQAEGQFRLWTGQEPPRGLMLRAATEWLSIKTTDC